MHFVWESFHTPANDPDNTIRIRLSVCGHVLCAVHINVYITFANVLWVCHYVCCTKTAS